jgi:parvulin-like peptidyl-prolyl isomerase
MEGYFSDFGSYLFERNEFTMSASRVKKTRQSDLAAGANTPKTVREARERKQEHRSNILYATVGIVFVLVAAFLLVWNSNVIQRNATALSVDGTNYSAADVSYYYSTAYNSFVNNYSNYLSYLGLSTNSSLKSQSLNDTAKSLLGVTEDMTWHQYFINAAKSNLVTVNGLLKDATANNYTFTDEMQSTMDSTIASLEQSAKSAGYSTRAYLKALYGSYMNMATFKAQLKNAILTSQYQSDYLTGLNYSDDQINSYYTEHKNDIDVASYDYVNIKATATATKDADGNSVAPTDEENAAAKTAAEAAANDIYARYKNGESLSDAAASYSDIATAGTTDKATNAGTTATDWVFDSARQSGDSAVLSNDTYYYVVVFNSRGRNEYNTVDVRHILFKVDSSSLDSSSETYESDLAALQDQAKAKADDVLNQWKSGAATEDSFAELANANSDDTGSNTTGGLYTQIYKDQMVTEFNDWIFDPARKSGDCDIVFAQNTGYHIIYFVGFNDPYWKVQVRNALSKTDYSDWMTGLTDGITAEEHAGLRYVSK